MTPRQVLAVYSIPAPDVLDAYYAEIDNRRRRHRQLLSHLGRRLSSGRVRTIEATDAGRLAQV